MADANRCPSCGAELLANAPEGLCPRCLMQALAGDTSVPADDAGMTGSFSTDPGYTHERAQADSEATQTQATGTVGGTASAAAGATGTWTGDPAARTRTADDGAGDDASRRLRRGSVVRYFGDHEVQKELGRGGSKSLDLLLRHGQRPWGITCLPRRPCPGTIGRSPLAARTSTRFLLTRWRGPTWPAPYVTEPPPCLAWEGSPKRRRTPEGLAIREPHVAADPKNAAERDYLSSDLENLCDVLRRSGRPAEARAAAERAVAIREALSAEQPTNHYHRGNLASSLLRRGLARDPTGASADTRRALAIWEELRRDRVSNGSRPPAATPPWRHSPAARAQASRPARHPLRAIRRWTC